MTFVINLNGKNMLSVKASPYKLCNELLSNVCASPTLLKSSSF